MPDSEKNEKNYSVIKLDSSIPDNAIIVKSYREYQEMISIWARGELDTALIVIGSAGIGKSEMAIRALDEAIDRGSYAYLKGRATAKAVYMTLCEFINSPVVIDDVDELLSDVRVTGLLKMLLETTSPKSVQWKTSKTMEEDSSLPPEISTTSQTMILANEIKTLNKNFSAVLNRATIIHFAPSAEAIHQYTATWFDLKKDRDVYEYIGERLALVPSPSCRFYFLAAKWKKAGLQWKSLIDRMMSPSESKQMLIIALLKKYENEKGGVKLAQEEYTNTTGESEQAFYRIKTALDAHRGERSSRSKGVSEGMKKKHAERKAKGLDRLGKPKT